MERALAAKLLKMKDDKLVIEDLIFEDGNQPLAMYPNTVCLLKQDGVYKHIYVESDCREEESNTFRFYFIGKDGTLSPRHTIFPIPEYLYEAPGFYKICLTVHKYVSASNSVQFP